MKRNSCLLHVDVQRSAGYSDKVDEIHLPASCRTCFVDMVHGFLGLPLAVVKFDPFLS